MDIENEVFKRATINFNKLDNYGFVKKDDKYFFEKKFLNGNFNAIIIIDSRAVVSGKIIDLLAGEEYLNFRSQMSGEFIGKVREEYINILEDIKRNCFSINYFMSAQANRITQYIKEKYVTVPEFLWEKSVGDGIFRNSNSNKWFGIIMNIDFSKIDNGNGQVEVMNVKLDENTISLLLKKKGYYPAYHMNKKNWISIILNDTVDDKEIFKLIDISYNMVK